MHVIAFTRRSFQRAYNHKAIWFEPENGIDKNRGTNNITARISIVLRE
jgi:hypothetical protein